MKEALDNAYSGEYQKAIELKENSNFEEILYTNAGSTVTSHCGKGTIGILYLDEELDCCEE